MVGSADLDPDLELRSTDRTDRLIPARFTDRKLSVTINRVSKASRPCPDTRDLVANCTAVDSAEEQGSTDKVLDIPELCPATDNKDTGKDTALDFTEADWVDYLDILELHTEQVLIPVFTEDNRACTEVHNTLDFTADRVSTVRAAL